MDPGKQSQQDTYMSACVHTRTHTPSPSFVIRNRLTRLMTEAERSQIRDPSRAVSVQKLAGSGARKS